MGFLDFSFKKALGKTRSFFFQRIQEAHDLDEIEEVLYLSDMGSKTVEKLMKSLRSVPVKGSLDSKDQMDFYRKILKREALNFFKNALKPGFDPSFIESDAPFKRDTFFDAKSFDTQNLNSKEGLKSVQKGEQRFGSEGEKKLYFEGLKEPAQGLQKGRVPEVWLFVGVNGVGKTTVIGKLAYFLKKKGKVLVVAGDTFRAAAQLQLRKWSLETGVDFYESKKTKDSAAIAFEACEKAKGEGEKGVPYDFVLIDTAGRLTAKSHLMEELKKVRRVIRKVFFSAPQEVFVVLDASSGQNTFFQAEDFQKALQVTGIIFNKLDGSAKGGVLLGLVGELRIPIYWLGIGEKKDDLRSFQAEAFVDSLFSH